MPRPISTGASGRATTSIPTRSSRSIWRAASSSGRSRSCRTTSGISTRSARWSWWIFPVPTASRFPRWPRPGRPVGSMSWSVRPDDPFAAPRRSCPSRTSSPSPRAAGVRMLPGANGGSEWSAPAYSPETGYLYVLGLHQPMYYKTKHQPLQPPAFWLGGVFVGDGRATVRLVQRGRPEHRKDRLAEASQGPDDRRGARHRRRGGLHRNQGPAIPRLRREDRPRSCGVSGPRPGSTRRRSRYAVDGQQYVAVAAGGNYQINAPRGDQVLAFALTTAGARKQAARGRAVTRVIGAGVDPVAGLPVARWPPRAPTRSSPCSAGPTRMDSRPECLRCRAGSHSISCAPATACFTGRDTALPATAPTPKASPMPAPHSP